MAKAIDEPVSYAPAGGIYVNAAYNIDSFTTLLNTVLPVLTMTVTFAVYTTIQKQQLTAAKGLCQNHQFGQR